MGSSGTALCQRVRGAKATPQFPIHSLLRRKSGHGTAYESKGFIDWLLFRRVHGFPFWVLLMPLAGLCLRLCYRLVHVYSRQRPRRRSILSRKQAERRCIISCSINGTSTSSMTRRLCAATRKLGDLFWKIGDVRIIDRFGPNGVAGFASGAAKRVSKLQTGYLISLCLRYVARRRRARNGRIPRNGGVGPCLQISQF